jgi:hypothetical protein
MRIIFVGIGAAWLKKNLEKYFYSGKRGSSDCLRDDSVPMACHFFIKSPFGWQHISQIPPLRRAVILRTSRHNSNIKHLNELLYHGAVLSQKD